MPQIENPNVWSKCCQFQEGLLAPFSAKIPITLLPSSGWLDWRMNVKIRSRELPLTPSGTTHISLILIASIHKSKYSSPRKPLHCWTIKGISEQVAIIPLLAPCIDRRSKFSYTWSKRRYPPPQALQHRSPYASSQPSILHMPTAADPLYFEDNRTETFSIVPTTELSTNYTESGRIGPGRTLGIFYDYAGRRLERVVGRVAHKAGFGPQATYLKMQELLSTE